MTHRICAPVLATIIAATCFDVAIAAPKYGPGASDKEIKIGQTTAYSGAFSAWSAAAQVQAAYFKMLNEEGGVNGRKINFVSLDDSYSPPKTVEQTRRLVESDEVLFLFGSLGAASNTAVHKYLNAKKIPQLFPQSGAAKWSDPKKFPWTMGWMPSFANEGFIYGKYVLAHIPDAKVAVFFQNDDYGKDYIAGFKRALGGSAAKMIVSEKSYESTDPTVDSQIVLLKSSGANVLMDASSPKFAAQAIRKMGEIGWRPTHFLASPSAVIDRVFKVAGLDYSKGIISAAYLKDPGNPAMKDDSGVKDYLAFLAKYLPNLDPQNRNAVWGYASAETITAVLKQCGDDLTRENVMHQAANLRDVSVTMLLPGILMNTSSSDYEPIEDERLQVFDGSDMKTMNEKAEK
jgi:branched-chain amino acid transport system substrate-binding protein